MSRKVLIVGGVAGGATAAARLRRLDEHAEIILFEKDEHISYANCGLPYYIGETIRDRSALLVQTPENMRRRFRIDVRIRSDVTAVNPAQKTVTVRSAERGIYEERFDQLILSPGAAPIKPPIPGIEHPKLFTLRTIPDTDRIKAFVDGGQVRKAVIIGGGFIGVELAENLIGRGVEVTMVEAAPHLLAAFDADMAAYAERELAEHGVQLILGDGVKSFGEGGDGRDGDALTVTLQSGRQIRADMAVLSIGVKPATAFLQGSGIALGPRGHILVNEKMETNQPGIYAVGDAVEVRHAASGQPAAVALAGPANKQGRIAADNICGLDSVYTGAQGTAIIKLFGLTGAATGLNERSLRALGRPFRVVHIHPASHATYYPGAEPIALKLIFDDTGAILGAQAFGRDGVDKRIDVIATAMRLKGTVQDLTELDLCYAPPFSSAKDPVNIAGYAAQNVLRGLTDVVLPRDIKDRDRDRVVLVDVRSPEEHRAGHIDGDVLIPLDELRDRLDELDPSKEIWVYCQVGLRGYTAARILQQAGFTVKNLTGGYKSYCMEE